VAGNKIDKKGPAIACATPVPSFIVNQSPAEVTATATDGGSGPGSQPLSAPADTSSVGTKQVEFSAADNLGNQTVQPCAYKVLYDFHGFLPPIDNPSTGRMNGVKAGSAVPVKFTLGGDMGLEVLAAGYPRSVSFPCGNAPVDVVPESELAEAEATRAAGGSALSYDPATGVYTYVWKTDKAWTDQCRQLVVKLADGQSKWVNFKAMR
jgi:hypothetical protein